MDEQHQHVALLRAQGHPHTDLAPALRHRIGHHAVDAHDSEQQRNRREAAELSPSPHPASARRGQSVAGPRHPPTLRSNGVSGRESVAAAASMPGSSCNRSTICSMKLTFWGEDFSPRFPDERSSGQRDGAVEPCGGLSSGLVLEFDQTDPIVVG
jgi:hypothetical protein